MTDYTARNVLLKDANGNYLIPYTEKADLSLSNLNASGKAYVAIKGYDSTATYSLNEVVMTIVSGSVLFYKSLANNNTSALSDTTKWEAVSFGGGSPAWGNITGTLSNQTDLQNVLDGKANTDLSNLSITGNDKFVTKDTNQTITGSKTINTESDFVNLKFKVPDLASNATIPPSEIWKWNNFIANDDSVIGLYGVEVSPTYSRFYNVTRKKVNGTEISAYISTYILNDGTQYVQLPSSPSSNTDNSTKAATTAWVNAANKTGYGIGAPNYAAYQSITLNSNKQYTATENGWIRAINGNGVTFIINGCTVSYGTSGTTNTMFPIAKGQTLTASSSVGSLLFVPCM